MLPQARGNGNKRAHDRLATFVCREPLPIAGCLTARDGPNHALRPTALINETCLPLGYSRQSSRRNYVPFFDGPSVKETAKPLNISAGNNGARLAVGKGAA